MFEVLLSLALLATPEAPASRKQGPSAQPCIDCHTKVTPGVVADWKTSKHAEQGITCIDCHGAAHDEAKDAALAQLPTPETCARCHATQLEEFKAGKHSLAWTAMKAMPAAHHQSQTMIEGMKGCGGCHKIGLKSAEDMKELRASGEIYGVASCDSCHTRHTFAVAEARSPEACETCHMGFDHPQWEEYVGSKHGVRHAMKVENLLPASTSAPTCASCHMKDGDHGVKTSWGFLGVRLPMPEDRTWAADRTVILKALGILDAAGKPTARLDLVKSVSLARVTQEEWQSLRTDMEGTCRACHAGDFASKELAKGDTLIKESDHLMAEAIETVAGLYRDGVIPKPAGYVSPYPDLLMFDSAPTAIEQKLFVMFLEHRLRTFQGAFHSNPDYAFWYGWAEMQRDVNEIRELAEQMRAAHRGHARSAKH